MHYNSDQVVRGIMNYADSEVINKLPTIGKWVLGTGLGIASAKVNDIVVNLQGNQVMKMLGIIDDEGMFDIDMLARYMRESADKYGKAIISIPILGEMSFSSQDVETLKNYITRA